MKKFFELRNQYIHSDTCAGLYVQAVSEYKRHPCADTVVASMLVKTVVRAAHDMGQPDLECLRLYRNLVLLIMMDGSGRHVIRPSATLVDMLMRTEVNVPLSVVRPPHLAVCIELPPNKMFFENGAEKHELTEAYVTDYGVDEQNERKLVINLETTNNRFILDSGIDGHKDQIVESIFEATVSRSTADVAQATNAALARASHYRICRLVANLFLYMSQPAAEADVEFKPDTRLVAAKKMPRGPQREATEANFYRSKASQVYIVGFKTEEELKKLSAQYEHQGGTKRPHWRRGHWQRYWVGPRSQPELRKTITRWVKPMIVAGIDGIEPPPPTTYIVQEPREA